MPPLLPTPTSLPSSKTASPELLASSAGRSSGLEMQIPSAGGRCGPGFLLAPPPCSATGKGAFGVVKKAKHLTTGVFYAVKIVDKAKCGTPRPPRGGLVLRVFKFSKEFISMLFIFGSCQTREAKQAPLPPCPLAFEPPPQKICMMPKPNWGCLTGQALQGNPEYPMVGTDGARSPSRGHFWPDLRPRTTKIDEIWSKQKVASFVQGALICRKMVLGGQVKCFRGQIFSLNASHSGGNATKMCGSQADNLGGGG